MIRVDKLVGERVLFFGELFFVVLGNLPRDLDFLQLSKSNISPHPKKFHSCWNPSVFVELYGLVPARWHAWKGAIYGAVWVFIREKSPLHSRCSEFSRLNPPPRKMDTSQNMRLKSTKFSTSKIIASMPKGDRNFLIILESSVGGGSVFFLFWDPPF